MLVETILKRFWEKIALIGYTLHYYLKSVVTEKRKGDFNAKIQIGSEFFSLITASKTAFVFFYIMFGGIEYMEGFQRRYRFFNY